MKRYFSAFCLVLGSNEYARRQRGEKPHKDEKRKKKRHLRPLSLSEVMDKGRISEGIVIFLTSTISSEAFFSFLVYGHPMITAFNILKTKSK